MSAKGKKEVVEWIRKANSFLKDARSTAECVDLSGVADDLSTAIGLLDSILEGAME